MLDAPLPNGVRHINGHSTPESPVDSPATPVDNTIAPDIKIDVDYNESERESDARHEPMPLKLDKMENASVLPQVGTPADPATIPIEPPKGTPPPPPGQLLEDVRMAEQESLPTEDSDVVMADAVDQPSTVNGQPNGHDLDSPAATPVSSSIPAVPSSETPVDSLGASSPYPNNKHANDHTDDDHKQPPAKRARKYSDADKASLANTGTPPPASLSPGNDSNAPLPSNTTLTPAQWRFATSTIRTLKKVKEAAPFLQPVDPVALNIPHYPSIIKHPMDFSTIDRKLASSNPAKPDPNPANPKYLNADEFIADVRLIFSNCVTFNGPEHAVTLMGKRVEAVFDKQIKQMPPPEERKPPVVKKVATPPPPPPPVKKAARRPSMNVPVIRRLDDPAGRPKREIHPPPPKDLPYADIPKKTRKAKSAKNDVNLEQLRFCEKLFKELHRKSHYSVAQHFYEPVDWVKLNIPYYPKVIKKPMDLATMKKKLQNGDYPTADKFRDDFKLMIANCLKFNPAGNPVHEAGRGFDRIFDEKWANLPSLHSHEATEEEYEDDEDDSEDERSRMIANMENQILTMKSSLDVLKKKGKEQQKKEKKKKEKAPAPVASTSKAASKPAKATAASNGRKKGRKAITDDDVLSFEQKKDLSDTISKLDGAKLEKVIQIIHDGVPEIRDSTEEIELEIDLLPASVLTKLYNFVIRPMRTPATKRSRTGKGTGTGGLKRKSMDEDVEAAKIRALEARMKLFEQGNGEAGISDVVAGEESEHSSAESSSESSASDSE